MTRETTVLFFKDLYRTLQAIPDADAGILMRALFAVANGEAPDLSGSVIAAGIFPIAADQMKRLEEYRQTKANAGRAGGISSGQTRSKTKQNEANAKQTEPPYPSPYPSPVYIGRNPKVQKAFGFSTERQDVNYDEIARRLREEREAAE